MFNSRSFIVLFTIISISLGNPTVFKNADTKISQCGGTIDADSDYLNYPDAGEALQEGEVCVWTIHLETTKNFKFNFTSLNVNSNNEDCRDGGIRIYSLTNLVPSDNLESYTFCDKKPSDDNFYLGENVAVVILYVGSGNTNPGSGFTLSWEGSAFDPMKTKHVSSFSTASSGIIRYPVVGHYEANLAATWLIKSVAMQEATTSDFSLESLELEPCGNPDKCTCDALMLYEISQLGVLSETQRFCGEVSSGLVAGIQSRFIVAYFTDFNTDPSGGGGFEFIYNPSLEATTIAPETTTTEIETTTTTEIISTSCGGLLEARSGLIRYKEDVYYSGNERCVWTIRIPDASQIKFSLLESGLIDTYDGVVVTSFRRAVGFGNPSPDVLVENYVLSTYEGPRTTTLNGSVATVVFYTDEYLQNKGFVLRFEAQDRITPPYHPLSKDTSISVTNGYQTIAHPIGSTFYYTWEFSTFLFTPNNNTFNNDTSTQISYVKKGMEARCYDKLDLYVLGRTSVDQLGFIFADQYCGNHGDKDATFEDVVAVIFSTDHSQESTGFFLSCIET